MPQFRFNLDSFNAPITEIFISLFVVDRLGRPGPVTPPWLILTDKENLPKPERVAFPKPPKAPDGSLVYERVPNKPEAEKIPLNNMSPSLKKRPYDEMNGIDSKY